MTQVEVAKLVACLMAAFPSNRASVQTSAVYERLLTDLDYPTANAAVERLIATARFMPTVADVREAALQLASGDVLPGGEAWGGVLKKIASQGSWRTPGVDFKFDDPVTAKCVAALGWENLCLSENQTADRARFIELYDKLAAQHRRGQLSDTLPAVAAHRELRSTVTPIGAAVRALLPRGDES